MTIFRSLFFLAREVFNAAVVSRADGFFRGLSDGAEVLAEREAQEEVSEPTLPLWPESEAPLLDAFFNPRCVYCKNPIRDGHQPTCPTVRFT